VSKKKNIHLQLPTKIEKRFLLILFFLLIFIHSTFRLRFGGEEKVFLWLCNSQRKQAKLSNFKAAATSTVEAKQRAKVVFCAQIQIGKLTLTIEASRK